MTETEPCDVSDINKFWMTSQRGKNDEWNRIREKAITLLSNPDHPYFSVEAYSEKWNKLHTALSTLLRNELTLRNITDFYNKCQIQRYGTLGDHKDHGIILMKDDKVLLELSFEFKFDHIPQIANEPESNAYIPYSLPKMWYYDGPLDKIIALYPDLSISKPPFEDYKKDCHHHLSKSSPALYAFYSQFYTYDRKDDKSLYKRKQGITNESLHNYLITHGATFDYAKLNEKLKKDQTGKIYGIWKQKSSSFIRKEIRPEQLTAVSILGVKGAVLYLATKATSVLALRLRWKNTIGICTPAWQINVEDKTPKNIKQCNSPPPE